MSQIFFQCTTSLNTRFFVLAIVFVWVDFDYFNIHTYYIAKKLVESLKSCIKMLATRRGLIYFDQINDENILKIYILSLEMDELVTG